MGNSKSSNFYGKQFDLPPISDHLERQSEESLSLSSSTTLLAVGSAVFLGSLLTSIGLPRQRFRLENDHFCGKTVSGEVCSKVYTAKVYHNNLVYEKILLEYQNQILIGTCSFM